MTLIASNFPWIRKTIHPIKTRRGEKTVGERKSLKKLEKGVEGEGGKREQSRGLDVFPSQVIHLCLQNCFREQS